MSKMDLGHSTIYFDTINGVYGPYIKFRAVTCFCDDTFESSTWLPINCFDQRRISAYKQVEDEIKKLLDAIRETDYTTAELDAVVKYTLEKLGGVA